VTDVNAILGYLDPERILGGSIRVDPDKARAALAPIAGRLGRSIEDTALGVMDVADAVMARALRRVTVHRGADLREAALIAFGGAGPMHAVSLARHVGIARVVVPAFSGGFSAFGCITAPELIARQRTLRLASRDWDAGRFDAQRLALVEEAEGALRRSGTEASAIRLRETALVRYVGQSVAVEVPYEAGLGIEALGERFRAVHARLYGYATDEPFLLESLRVEASAPAVDSRLAPAAGAAAVLAPFKVSRCCFAGHGVVDTPRYDRARLPAEATVAGPAIVEDAWSTVIIPPGARCLPDQAGHLHVEVGA
jgi:N-methylhydantoinase A